MFRGKDRDEDRKKKHKDKKKDRHAHDSAGNKEPAEVAPDPVNFTADMTPEEIQMMQAMGIPFAFDTTQGKMVRLQGGPHNALHPSICMTLQTSTCKVDLGWIMI